MFYLKILHPKPQESGSKFFGKGESWSKSGFVTEEYFLDPQPWSEKYEKRHT